ncbi:uncharacterized protein LOC134692519, partial [Mytilus trossulus]|uniref:uncharacterized protein LOC134692519 n=1 Tax=Mytilus trossulus TaxID=6551 RepID=UPI0030047DE1
FYYVLLIDWPVSNKKIAFVKKDDITKCTEKSLTEIYKRRKGKVYDMTGNKKGKLLIISNVQCHQRTETKSTVDSYSKETESIEKCGKLVDFDQTSILQLFKEIKYESKAATDLQKNVSGEIMQTFLADQLCKGDNSVFDSLVIVIFSGGLKYKPGHIYDKDGIEVEREGIIEMIRKSTAFKDKPKIVIIRTYNFEGDTEAIDVLDAEKHDIPLTTKEPNKDDLFVVSSQPRTKTGPWIIGDGIQGSYFIQAFIHIFKYMAHDKSFMEMMKEIDNCLTSALVTGKGKQHVANVIVLEHSEEKDLFFFPGLNGIVTGWPDLKTGGQTVQKKNIKQCSGDLYNEITKETTTYSMTGKKRGQFILISNTQYKPQSSSTENKEEEDKEKRHSDFDNTSMNQLFKYMGYDTDGTQVNKTNEEIKEFLKEKFSKIDNDASSMYDSLVILFLSGKYESSTSEIYDRDGKIVPLKEMLEITKSCKHFKGKPKVVFIQAYSVKEAVCAFVSSDSAAKDILQNSNPNTDDLFVVSNYQRTEQGPWLIGEHMSGSYFIQAIVHVFKNFAFEKSFMELLQEANSCLMKAVVPVMTTDGCNSGVVEKKMVAQIVLLQFCEEKKLYFFPGYTNASSSGMPVHSPTD